MQQKSIRTPVHEVWYFRNRDDVEIGIVVVRM